MEVKQTETMIKFESEQEEKNNVKTLAELKELYKTISEYYKEKAKAV